MISWIKRLFKKEEKSESKNHYNEENDIFNGTSHVRNDQNNIGSYQIIGGCKNTINSTGDKKSGEKTKYKSGSERNTSPDSHRSLGSDDSNDLLNPMNPLSPLSPINPLNPISPIWHDYSNPIQHESSHDSGSSWDSSNHDSGSSWDSSSDSSSFDSSSFDSSSFDSSSFDSSSFD